MKFAYLTAIAFCLAAASAGAQTTPKPAATPAAAPVAAKPVVAPAAKPAPVAAPVVAPMFAPPPVAAPAPRPAPAPVSATAGDPVEAWVRKMINHHRAAIAMAEPMMTNQDDRGAARVAKSTYYREQRDIVTLQSWLKRHGKSDQ